MQVRAAITSDYQAVEALWREQNACHAALEPTRVRAVQECMSPDQYADVIRDPLKEIAVAQANDGIVGAVLLIEKTCDGRFDVPRTVALIQEICVAQTHQRTGVGSSLVAYVHEWAGRRELSSIVLNVWARNTAALSFYRSLGFDDLKYEMSKPAT